MPEVEMKAERDENIDSDTAPDAHVSKTIAPRRVLGLGFSGALKLKGHNSGVSHQLARTNYMHGLVIPHLIIALGLDVLALELDEVVKDGGVDVFRVNDTVKAEATIRNIFLSLPMQSDQLLVQVRRLSNINLGGKLEG